MLSYTTHGNAKPRIVTPTGVSRRIFLLSILFRRVYFNVELIHRGRGVSRTTGSPPSVHISGPEENTIRVVAHDSGMADEVHMERLFVRGLD